MFPEKMSLLLPAKYLSLFCFSPLKLMQEIKILNVFYFLFLYILFLNY